MKEQKNHRHLHFRTVEEAGTHPQTGTPFNAIANETMNLSSSNPHLIHVTFTAITKVIAAVLIGAYSSSAIPSRFTTLRDFRLLLTAVLLPALTIASTAKSIHPHTLIECSVFVWMSVVLTGLGSGLAALFQHCFYHPHRSGGCNARASGGSPTGVPANFAKDVELRLRYDEVEEEEVPSRTPTTTREHHRKKKKKKGIPYVAVKVSAAWRRAGVSGRDIVPHLTAPDSDTDYNLGYAWASYIAFSVFDTITLPLSLLKSLSESVSWIDFSTGSAYTFIFSIFPTVYAWTAGVYFVKRAKRETKKRMMIRLLLQEHLTRRHLSDAATQTAAECGVEAASCELHPYDWERAGLLRLYPFETGEEAPNTTAVSLSSSISTMSEEEGRERPTSLWTQRSTCTGGTASIPALDTATNLTNPNTTAIETSEGAPQGETGDCLPEDVLGTPFITPQDEAGQRRGAGSTAQNVPREEAAEESEARAATPGPGSPSTAFSAAAAAGGEEPAERREAHGMEESTRSRRSQRRRWPRSLSGYLRLVFQESQRLLHNPPFMSILIGMGIGLVPFLHDLFFDGGPLEMFMDSVALVGQGNIPCALLLLGGYLEGTAASSRRSGKEDGRGWGEEGILLEEVKEWAPDRSGSTRRRGLRQRRWLHPLQRLGCRLRRSGETWLRNAATNTVEEPAPQPMSDQHRAASVASEVERVEECFVVRWAYDAEQRRVRQSFSPSAAPLHERTASLTTTVAETSPTHADHHVALDSDPGPSPPTPAEEPSVWESCCVLFSFKEMKIFFVVGVLLLRLVVMPFLCFLLLITLVQTLPFLFGGRGKEDLTMILAIVVQAATPTAVQSAIIFDQEEFMTHHWSKMLFLQYLVSIPSLVLWTWLGLRYTEGLAAERAALQ